MGRFKFVILLFLPLFGFAQDYPRFELYQLVQGADSGQFVTTGVDSNLDFNSVLRFRFQDSTLLIGADTVITDATIVPILLATIDAGLGIEVNQLNGQIFIESLSIEDSIYNGSGSIIPKGTPLYASDTQGNYWDVAPARADDPSKMPVVVIAGEEIGIGEVGLGLIKGHIKQVNTTGLADGSEVYVGATGGYTSTKPTDEGVIIQRLGTVIKGETTNGSGIINLGDEGFWNDYTSLIKLRDTLVLVRGSITTEIGDSLTNYASRTELADTASAIRADFPTGSSLWQEGATPGEIYYNSGNVGIGNTDPNYPLHVTGRIYSSDDILVDDELIFGTDGTGVFPYIDNVAGKMLISNYLTTSSTLFDFYDRYNTVSPLLINTSTDTYQIEANGKVYIDGNLTQSGTIVQDGGSVTFNNTQGNYDFGVYSDNCCTTTPFMWVDASADKVQIGSGNPQYTLDVTGDINFTGDLYDDGVLFSGGGVTINNNTNNYLLTASGTANTINGEANLTYNGTKLSVSGRIEQTGIGFSTLFGLDAGLNDDLTNNYSTAFGYNALKNNTTGIYNSAFGVRALESITSGSSNNAFGIGVLENTSTGSNNSGFGNSALNDVTTGTYNAVFGNASGDVITTGIQNTIFGSLSGRTLTTGNYNVFIGSDVGASSNSTTNEIAIGYDAAGQGSNTIMLGNSSITDLYCYDTSISSPSDKRDKKKIKSLKLGLDFVRELRPVIFEWDMREGTKKGIKDIGFIAQELNKVEKNTNEFEYINLTKHDKKLDRWFAQYSNLIPVYAKAIQDLDDKVNQQQIIIESQDKRIHQLEEMVKQLIEKK